MIQFLFDVDGTLTNPREPMNPKFAKYFGEWIAETQSKGHEVFIATGADRQKTLRQIGLPMYRLMNGVFQNCANQLFVRNSTIYQSPWSISAHLRLDLLILAEKSPWYKKGITNIEERVGMVNFSTVGIKADPQRRKAFGLWDKQTNERGKIIEWLSMRYPKLEFVSGGQTSIDIYPRGKDKSQALTHMTGKTIFFGDKCFEGGNDHTIAKKADKYHQVEGWKETMLVIRSYYGYE